jgi:phosphatidylglycerophosphate synthase
MFDKALQTRLSPCWQALAKPLSRLGVQADHVTWAAWLLGMLAAVAIANAAFTLGLVLMLLSRAADALDGAVARINGASDRGGFLDIALDFWFYASIPLAFAIVAPAHNALASAALLASFITTATSLLAFSTLMYKQGRDPLSTPNKSFYFVGGLTEGGETLAAFVAMCLWPQHFAAIAWVFAALCIATALTRLHHGWRHL